jgi:hypothetical protein
VAKAKSGATFNEAIYTTEAGFNVAAAEAKNSSAEERPVHGGMRQPAVENYAARKTLRR